MVFWKVKVASASLCTPPADSSAVQIGVGIMIPATVRSSVTP